MAVMDSVKLAYDLAKKGATIELQEAIMTLREEVVALQEKNIGLVEELRDLKAQQQIMDEMIYEDGMYWRVKDKAREGPFCQQCFDANVQVIRLQHNPETEFTEAYHSCHTCKSQYDA